MLRAPVVVAAAALVAAIEAAPAPTKIDVTVHEGTSMSVGVSPDGKTLAIDLQGSIWTLPATGGTATRITDVFNDARQPVWGPDGSNQRKLTWGPEDDREPAFSHDGTRIAFSSDRGDPLGSNYNIFVLDL